MTLTTERTQFAAQNEMSMEFVNWFFDEKKEGCGNVWFIMAAAMWEGWKGRDDREAQPVEYGDAYQGAREDLSIWKRRALEAEDKMRHLEKINDHLVKEAQGEHRMGEPILTAPPAPAVPAEAKLGEMPFLGKSERGYVRGWNDCRAAMLESVAATSSIPMISDGYKMMPIEPTAEMINAALASGALSIRTVYRAMLAAAPEGGNEN